MAASPLQMIKKLQQACNKQFDAHLLYTRTQFYSKSQNRPVNMFTVKKAIWDSDKDKFRYEEIFSSGSQLQIVKFLRDYWYELNGWDIPTDDEEWNKQKELYKSKKKTWHDVEYALEQ